MTVDELLSRISSRELTEWRSFSSKEPIGDARSDFQTALLAALIANGSRDPSKKPEPFSPLDFVVDFWREPEDEAESAPNWQGNLSIAEVITVALGGTDNRSV
jgi:hypothetical protein